MLIQLGQVVVRRLLVAVMVLWKVLVRCGLLLLLLLVRMVRPMVSMHPNRTHMAVRLRHREEIVVFVSELPDLEH